MTAGPRLHSVDDIGTRYLAEPAKQALRNRLARLEGHLHAVRGMLEDGRCADEILLQVAAVKAALNRFASSLLEHELKACVDECMPGSPEERLDRVTNVMATLLKQT